MSNTQSPGDRYDWIGRGARTPKHNEPSWTLRSCLSRIAPQFNDMFSTPRQFIGILLFLAVAAFVTGEAKAQDDFPAFSVDTMPRPVYPFDALVTKKHGVVHLECAVTPQGWLIHAKVIKSSAPEFLAATMAFVETLPFAVPDHAPKNSDGQPIIKYEVDFDDSKCGETNTLMTCPPESGLKILLSLRKDPSGNQFSKVKMLDAPLVPVSQRMPRFPQAMRKVTEIGSAIIEFYIDEEGLAVLPRTVSATHESFGYAACQAVSGGWRFKPPLKGGKPTIVKVRVPVAFKMKKDDL